MNPYGGGVMIPPGQRGLGSRTGEPKRVTQLVEAKTFATQFTDQDGIVHEELIHQIGNQWFRAPNGENYFKTLIPVGKGHWLTERFNEKLAAQDPATLPKEDSVNVTLLEKPSKANGEGG
jgi:hypothetical protein